MKKILKPRLGYFIILLSLAFLGCTPKSNSSSGTSEIKLPTRPTNSAGLQTPILSRELLFKNDSRISYCEILEGEASSYSGIRDTQLEPLASLSKAVTTAWALGSLGADFRYTADWYLKPVANRSGVYDAYLKTNYDPVVNTEKMLYFISELNTLGVKGLRELVIDETTRVYISVLSAPHKELSEIPVSTNETKENILLLLNSKNWAARTQKARGNLVRWAGQNGRVLNIPDTFTTEQVIFRNSNTINKAAYPYGKRIQSAPLFKYLKNMNVYSNNYLADALFESMGGRKAFQTFQKNALSTSLSEMQIYTGSGLALTNGTQRQDNLGTCFSMIKVLSYIKQLSSKAEMNLGQLFLNPTSDIDGTFSSVSNYSNSVVLKTGRLFENPAFNLAGFVATAQGTLLFVFLGHDFTETAANEIESMRGQMLDHVFSNYDTRPDYGTLAEYEIFL